MGEEVCHSASKICTSAAFDEIIILVVYLPNLALVGIDRKMFRPRAETVAFAILGAFILTLTYLPMVSALFLSRKTAHKRSISDRILEAVQRLYLTTQLPLCYTLVRSVFLFSIFALPMSIIIITWLSVLYSIFVQVRRFWK